jgi:hypothetical protein
VWDPVACCGDLGFPIVTQPGQLRNVLALAGKDRPVHVVYQPRGADIVEHWEHVAWLCLKAGHIILLADEVDMVCSAGSSKNAESAYWKKFQRPPALDQIVNFGRHSRVALVAISRAPQDVWRRLRGQAHRMLVFTMDDNLEIDALRSRLGAHSERLPGLERFDYLDWTDGGDVVISGGKL